MAFLDFLIDEEGIERQQTQADQVARSRFDPGMLDPQLSQAQDVATEGIADDQIRQQALTQLFGRTPSPSTMDQGTGSGRSLSFLESLNQNRQGQISQMETNLAMKEEQAQRQGEQQVAQIQSKQEQLKGQREARIKENRLQAEAEAQRRKKQLGSTVGKLFGTVAGSFLGPAGAAAGGALGGALAGGQGAVAGGVTGATSSLRNQRMDQGQIPDQMTLQDIFGMIGQDGQQQSPNTNPQADGAEANSAFMESLFDQQGNFRNIGQNTNNFV